MYFILRLRFAKSVIFCYYGCQPLLVKLLNEFLRLCEFLFIPRKGKTARNGLYSSDIKKYPSYIGIVCLIITTIADVLHITHRLLKALNALVINLVNHWCNITFSEELYLFIYLQGIYFSFIWVHRLFLLILRVI